MEDKDIRLMNSKMNDLHYSLMSIQSTFEEILDVLKKATKEKRKKPR